MFLNSFEITKKYGLLVGRGASAPSPKIDSVNEEIVDLGDFNIHIFTPQEQLGNLNLEKNSLSEKILNFRHYK